MILREALSGNSFRGSEHREKSGIDEDVEARHKLMYKGWNPKKRVDGNVNYLDHNIFALANRTAIKNQDRAGYSLHDSVDSITRSKSQHKVRFCLIRLLGHMQKRCAAE